VTNSVETNVSALLPAALAATDPHLLKVRGAQEKIVTLNVDIGKAFGAAIAAAHVEPLGYVAFCLAYEVPLMAHCKAALGYVSGNAGQVMLRAANLTAAGKAVPTRAAVLKKSGAEKPLSDTAYLELLRDAQRKAGLTVIKAGSGGDNRTDAQKAEAAAKAATAAAEAAAKAPAAAAPAAAPAPQVVGKPATAPAVPPAIDLKKAREDAAAMLMGNAKNGDLLLQALTSRKAALIAWLQEKPKA
jgi:pyruvate/2-oxoglutarate dehydrogenase complex dihydrolipoamide acyltransferase (E2) component